MNRMSPTLRAFQARRQAAAAMRESRRRWGFTVGLRAEGSTLPNAATLSIEDLRGRRPDELVEIINLVDGHIRELHQDESGALRHLSQPEEAAINQLLEVRTEAERLLEQHRSIAEVLKRKPQAVRTTMVNLGLDDDPYADVRKLSTREATERALRRLDADKLSTNHLTAAQRDKINIEVRRDGDLARRLLVTENEHYRTAWQKLMTDKDAIGLLDEDERNAVRAWGEYRVMAEGTTSAGGYGVPVFIDPSIILTAQESGNPFLELARQVAVTTTAWKGVSSAGVSWTFQTENTAAGDASPTLAQPVVNVWMARGFIPYSIEVGMDYPAFADEMARLLAAGYDELLVDKFTRGSGTNEPTGILTALSANTNVRVTVTTAGTLGAPDPYKVWKALPQKFRRRAAWLMSVGVNNAIRQLGTANVYHATTITLPESWADALFNRGVYESPYMPDVTTATSATDGYAVVGDFSNYVIARRAGMAVEFIPHIFDTTVSNRPLGQRGWFAYARIGGNSVNDIGFRLLTNS